MKLQKYCVYGTDQHEKFNKVPLRWEDETLVCHASPWHGHGRDAGHPWVGVAPAKLTYRDARGRVFSVPRGSEVYHWEANKIKFVGWKSIPVMRGGGRMTLRELCE